MEGFIIMATAIQFHSPPLWLIWLLPLRVTRYSKELLRGGGGVTVSQE